MTEKQVLNAVGFYLLLAVVITIMVAMQEGWGIALYVVGASFFAIFAGVSLHYHGLFLLTALSMLLSIWISNNFSVGIFNVTIRGEFLSVVGFLVFYLLPPPHRLKGSKNQVIAIKTKENNDDDVTINNCYDLGDSFVEENDVEAVKWYRKAAEKGHASAQHSLGNAYFSGEGVPQDYVHAYMWFALAKEGKYDKPLFSK